jgi:hypothetical protein
MALEEWQERIASDGSGLGLARGRREVETGMGGNSDWTEAEAEAAMDPPVDADRSSCCGEEMCARVNTDGRLCVR